MTPLEIPSLSPRKSRKRDRRNLDWMGDMVLKKSRYIKGQFNTIKEQAGLNMSIEIEETIVNGSFNMMYVQLLMLT
ncbi:hypothetical protein CsatB_024973 [Cannabis sativa]